MADILKDAEYAKQYAQQQQQEILDSFNKGNIDLEKAMKELTTVTKNDIKALNNYISNQKKLADAIQKNNQLYQNAASGSKSILQSLVDKLAGKSSDSNSFEGAWRVEKRFTGIEQIFKGNIASGAKSLFNSFDVGSKILKGPWTLAINAAITAVNEFDKHLTKINKSAFTYTGGLYSSYMNKTPAQRQEFITNRRKILRELNMSEQEGEIAGSVAQNISTHYRETADPFASFAKTRKSLESMGIDKSTADRLTTSLVKTEGLNSTQIDVFISRLEKTLTKKPLFMSDKQVIDETLKGFEANKKFNLSMGWINNQIIKYNKALEIGTRSMEDFASIQRSFYNQKDPGQLAGIANLLAQTGETMPSEIMNNLDNPLALGILMSDPENIKKLGPAMKAFAEGTIGQMGGAKNEYEAQGKLQLILSKILKTDVSRQAIIDLQKSGYDFEKTGLLGAGGGKSIGWRREDQAALTKEADDYQKQLKLYTDATTTLAKQMSEAIGKASDDIILAYKQQKEHEEAVATERYNDLKNNKITPWEFAFQSALMTTSLD